MSPIKEVTNLANINKYRILLQATRAGIPPSDCTLFWEINQRACHIWEEVEAGELHTLNARTRAKSAQLPS